MNKYNVNDPIFVESKLYQNFLKQNPTQGFLKIRAFAANQAIPISGLKIIVSKIIDNNKIIFFEGNTNESGIIEKINLPAPTLNTDNLNIPSTITYNIEAIYNSDDINRVYQVNIYENIYVVQTINIVPKLNNNMGDI